MKMGTMPDTVCYTFGKATLFVGSIKIFSNELTNNFCTIVQNMKTGTMPDTVDIRELCPISYYK